MSFVFIALIPHHNRYLFVFIQCSSLPVHYIYSIQTGTLSTLVTAQYPAFENFLGSIYKLFKNICILWTHTFTFFCIDLPRKFYLLPKHRRILWGHYRIFMLKKRKINTEHIRTKTTTPKLITKKPNIRNSCIESSIKLWVPEQNSVGTCGRHYQSQ